MDAFEELRVLAEKKWKRNVTQHELTIYLEYYCKEERSEKTDVLGDEDTVQDFLVSYERISEIHAKASAKSMATAQDQVRSPRGGFYAGALARAVHMRLLVGEYRTGRDAHGNVFIRKRLPWKLIASSWNKYHPDNQLSIPTLRREYYRACGPKRSSEQPPPEKAQNRHTFGAYELDWLEEAELDVQELEERCKSWNVKNPHRFVDWHKLVATQPSDQSAFDAWLAKARSLFDDSSILSDKKAAQEKPQAAP